MGVEPLDDEISPEDEPLVEKPVGFGRGSLASPASSTAFLQDVPGLFVTQRPVLLEVLTNLQGANRYNVISLPDGELPSARTLSTMFSTSTRSEAKYKPLLKANEQSDFCQRNFCPMFRSLTMPFKDMKDNTFITLEREFVWDPCYMPPSYSCRRQRLETKNAAGEALSTAETSSGCCSAGLCASWVDVKDGDGRRVFSLRVSDCNTHAGAFGNCCAPTCINQTYDVDLYDADGEYVNTSAFLWPGCTCGGLLGLSDMAIVFPKSATADRRASILGAFMLVELTVQEFKRISNSSRTNNRGPSSSGVTPQTMRRFM